MLVTQIIHALCDSTPRCLRREGQQNANMAALLLPTVSTYEVHEAWTVDTKDHEDHTFCGPCVLILFPVERNAA